MGYLHVEINEYKSPKKSGEACGDYVAFHRTSSAVYVILCDGLGHGIKANISAIMTASRILRLLKTGYSPREAFSAIAKTMNQAWGTGEPFSVFTIIHILNNGETTILSYEMPPPIFVSQRFSYILKQTIHTIDKAIIGEATCHLEEYEGVLIMSDGITQAGLGQGLIDGWTSEGVADYAYKLSSQGCPIHEMPEEIHNQALRYWRKGQGDDMTAVSVFCRKGNIVNLLTGPPTRQEADREFVRLFMNEEGKKIVCGAVSAKIVSKVLCKKMTVEQETKSIITPPRYFIEGIDYVAEGAITLNQVYNIFDEPEEDYEKDNVVSEIAKELKKADKVNIYLGKAANPASQDIMFRQQGILPRDKVTMLLSDRLRQKGKLVNIVIY